MEPVVYYKSKRGMSAIDFIESFELNFNLGNVVKYIVRAGKKPGESRLEALGKACDYLRYEIDCVTIDSLRGKFADNCDCSDCNGTPKEEF